MNVTNPLSTLSNLLPVASGLTPRKQLGSFEVNAREFGPVAATAIGAVQAGATAAETVYEFSTESLSKLGQAAEQAVDQVVDAVEDGYEAVSDTLGDIVDGVGDAAQSVAGYAALGLAAGKRLVNELA